MLQETLYLTLKEEASMVDSSLPGRSIEAFLDACGGGYLYDGLRRSLRSVYLDGYGPLKLLSGVSVLRLDIQVPALPALQELRDRVLGGDFERDVNAFLVADPLQIQVDQARFLEVYEQSLLAFGELAPEQRMKWKEMIGLQEIHLRLSSPSLAASFLDLLEVSPSAQGLYVASTEAKVLDFVQCLADQIRKDSGDRGTPERCRAKMKDTFSRLTLLHAPYTTLLLPELHGNCVYTEPVFNVDETFDFGMFEGTPNVLSECFEADSTSLLRIFADSHWLPSDPSHLASSRARCPGLTELKLPELPSSSSPSMLVSPDDEEQPVACLGLGGPPVKTFLFSCDDWSPDCPCGFTCPFHLLEETLHSTPPSPDATRYAQYTTHVLRALRHVVETFPGISLQHRLALLVPDNEFCDRLKPILQRRLRHRLPHRHLSLLSFEESSRKLRSQPSTVSATTEQESIVLDCIDNADGLGSLMTVCIGLDAPRSGHPGGMQTSQLYRGMMHAQLLAYVVNEHLPGGWLQLWSADTGDPLLRNDAPNAAVSAALEILAADGLSFEAPATERN
ncbi:unnamed protein product [Symbiodinium sp. CCMP2592]|nr:unnamed protein product [Symbiodinium sp. CCMP2592]